jgi:ATP-dependent Clp endopeptidase proteolytic subunit ClpP
MKTLTIDNKSGKLRLNEVVSKPIIERMIDEIGRLFGASAAASGADFGVIMNAAENAVDTLEIEINSPGGSVFDGYTIYNEIKSLRERGVEVTATVTGMCASMASVIAMACNTIRMVPHARMMIHDASNVVAGNADQLRAAADLLDGISEDIAAIYATRTGKDIEEARALMKKETWMSAKEAVAAGFADEIFDIRATTAISPGMSLFAKLFAGKNESEIEALLADVDSLRNDLTAAQGTIEALTADVTSRDQTIAEHVASIAAKKTKITDLEASLESATADLAAKDQTISARDAEIEAAKTSAGQLATETLAAIGQEQPLVIDETPAVDIIAQFNAITDPGERTRFYNQNRAAIARAHSFAK